MANITADQDLHAHEESYIVFRRIVFFAIMHIAFTIVCLALAFLGHLPLISVVLWIGGTLALLTTYVMHASHG